MNLMDKFAELAAKYRAYLHKENLRLAADQKAIASQQAACALGSYYWIIGEILAKSINNLTESAYFVRIASPSQIGVAKQVLTDRNGKPWLIYRGQHRFAVSAADAQRLIAREMNNLMPFYGLPAVRVLVFFKDAGLMVITVSFA